MVEHKEFWLHGRAKLVEVSSLTLTLENCPRCGNVHEGVTFRKLLNPVDVEGQPGPTHWAVCPNQRGEPIMLPLLTVAGGEQTRVDDQRGCNRTHARWQNVIHFGEHPRPPEVDNQSTFGPVSVPEEEPRRERTLGRSEALGVSYAAPLHMADDEGVPDDEDGIELQDHTPEGDLLAVVDGGEESDDWSEQFADDEESSVYDEPLSVDGGTDDGDGDETEEVEPLTERDEYHDTRPITDRQRQFLELLGEPRDKHPATRGEAVRRIDELHQ